MTKYEYQIRGVRGDWGDPLYDIETALEDLAWIKRHTATGMWHIVRREVGEWEKFDV